MVTKVISAAINGIDCRIINVEVDVSTGLPGIDMVGSVSPSVRESKERVMVAIKNTQFNLPAMRITINFTPADIRKDGSGYDLPIAVGLLAGYGFIDEDLLAGVLFAGELTLDGEIKAINGILPMLLEARKEGIRRCIIPYGNRIEASAVPDMEICCVYGLEDIINIFSSGKIEYERSSDVGAKENIISCVDNYEHDFADIAGQDSLKRALQIAAAGFHNVLMIGPPGSGKTMAAKCIPSILPMLTQKESIEVSKIYSVCGLLENKGLIKKRQFISPHHTISTSAMAGGGSVPKPGMISLSHKGVLFLDEIVHFNSQTLEILRQPIEDKKIHVARTNWNYVFPADFMLVAAMNPCPCGNYPNVNKCTCTPEKINRYINKISGPILDRIDICVEAPRINIDELSKKRRGDSSKQMRDSVAAALQIQKERYKECDIVFNSELTAKNIDEYVSLGTKQRKLLELIYKKMNLSLRGYHRILKVARTIADIDGEKDIAEKHIMEAVQYRSIEDKYWGGM